MRGASDIVRFDRVEGLALGAGISQRLGWGLAASVQGRYGLADEAWKGTARLTWRSAAGHEIVVSRFDDHAEAGEAPEVSALRNSIAAQEFGSDWTDRYGVRGFGIRLERALRGGGRVQIGYARRNERPLAVTASPANGDFAPAFPADTLWREAITLGWERTWLLAGGAGRVRTALDGTLAGVIRGEAPLGADRDYDSKVGRAGLDLEVSLPLGVGRLVARTLAASVTERRLGAAADLPAQDAVWFGGPVTGPGLGFHSLAGERGVSQRLEWQSRIPFIPIDLGRFGRVPSSLVLAPYVHAVWLDRPIRGEGGWHPAVGVGAIGLFELLRFDIARGVRDGRWTFSLDVAREFWPVL
jgi:hypothetical protein